MNAALWMRDLRMSQHHSIRETGRSTASADQPTLAVGRLISLCKVPQEICFTNFGSEDVG